MILLDCLDSHLEEGDSTLKKGIVIALPVAIVIMIGSMIASSPGGSITQPIEYNHKIHILEAGLDCIDCHQHYNTLARAGIPFLEVCADCHEEANGESAAEAKVVEHVQQGIPIAWEHVNDLPKHVYFSHLRHVRIGKLECARCHGTVDDLETPMKKPFKTLSMKWCMNCHEENSVSNDCLACHI